MFAQFFGFRESPFKIGFDRHYLFVGKHRAEAIAHLNYALMGGEGFIAITGKARRQKSGFVLRQRPPADKRCSGTDSADIESGNLPREIGANRSYR
jgi:hypothetical protein